MGIPVVRFQILAKAPDRLGSFYAEVFGWKVAPPDPMGHRAIDTDSSKGIPGGIWPSPPEGHSFAQLFVEVEDVTACAKAVEDAGGRIIIPPQKLPGGEEMAVIHDPEGIPMALFKPAR